jgi:micrococcal nuclease
MRRFLPYVLGMLLGCGLTLLVQYSIAFAARPAGGATGKPGEGPPAKLDLSVVSGGRYTFARVVDGDTFVLENGLHVRCLGVNTPEIGRYVKDPEPLGVEATNRTKALIEGQSVRLELGPTPLDAYGRVVARAFVQTEGGEVDLEETLAREGDTHYRAALTAAQKEAKDQKLGIWDKPAPVPPPNAAEYQFWATPKGKAFHRLECSSLRQSPPASLQGFRTREDALASGHTPCAHCCNTPEPVKPE